MSFDPAMLDRLFRYCLSLTRHRDDALDLMHSAIEKYLSLPQADVRQPVHYVRRIARNLFYDQQRHAKRYPMESLPEEYPPDFSERDLESMVIDEITLAKIWQNLLPAEREVIYLWAAEEMSTSEIALHLGQPRGTVLARLHRLKQRIQRQEKQREADSNG
jgi:RNA polymerase sigma factor (sigma-70 family)